MKKPKKKSALKFNELVFRRKEETNVNNERAANSVEHNHDDSATATKLAENERSIEILIF